MINALKKEFETQPLSVTGSVASIIALGNTAYAFPLLVQADIKPLEIHINLVIILCLFLLLEGFLASLFSRVFVFLRSLGEGFPLMLMGVNALVSAWVTGFNCLWLFATYGGRQFHSGYFVFSMIAGWLIASYFIYSHFLQRRNIELDNFSKDEESSIKSKHSSNFWVSFWVNSIAFLFVVIYMGNNYDHY